MFPSHKYEIAHIGRKLRFHIGKKKKKNVCTATVITELSGSVWVFKRCHGGPRILWGSSPP